MSAYSTVKRVLVGRPLESHLEGDQRLGKPVALAVFASDAISSTAYATEEILQVLVPISALAALDYLVPLSLVVVVLLFIVVTSYHQTIHAYPGGGGSYVVSRENLGVNPSLVAGASLLVDYTLTVAVSISAGVAAITSAVPELRGDEVELCVAIVIVLTLGNLRGVKESGRMFAFPTYGYIFTLGAMIILGLYRSYTGDLDALPVDQAQLDHFTHNGELLTGVTLFALLRAFSSGAVALTGVEAISNGVSAFRRPEARNAQRTLTWMGVILGTSFLGISVLAHRLQPTLSEDQTVLSTLGRTVFGNDNLMYFLLQGFTAAILTLAANTAYADFPRLSSIMAGDRFLPRQLTNRGDRLVFSNGIIVLAGGALVLIVAFGGDTTALIPLYAVGVFTAFTLSQSGMVIHHWKLRDPGWRRGIAINGTGAFATLVVLLVVLISKFTIGAWIPAVLIPIIVVALKAVHRHYKTVGDALSCTPAWKPPARTHTAIVLVAGVHRGSLMALDYARRLHPDHLIAVSVAQVEDAEVAIRQQWRDYGLDLPLEIIHAPYRDLVPPILGFLDELDARNGEDHVTTVILPEFVVHHWWEQIFHNQNALALKARLLFRPRTVVTSVPFHLGIDDQPQGRAPKPERSRRKRGRAQPGDDGEADVVVEVAEQSPEDRSNVRK
jgi:amino acid transporter